MHQTVNTALRLQLTQEIERIFPVLATQRSELAQRYAEIMSQEYKIQSLLLDLSKLRRESHAHLANQLQEQADTTGMILAFHVHRDVKLTYDGPRNTIGPKRIGGIARAMCRGCLFTEALFTHP